MDIPSKIDSILAERKKLLPRIDEALERIQKSRQVVERLEAYRSSHSSLPSEWMEQLDAISTKSFFEKQEEAVRQLVQLQKRFSRDEISISFVGRARQGKSLLLQRISGLEGDVIPSSDGSHCTGTRSIISNDPETETIAEIDFFSEQEYVEIVNDYIRNIFKHGEVPAVSSADGISRLNLAQLKDAITYEQQQLFERLEKYAAHVGEFRERFGTHITIPKDKIESYVAQYSSKDHDQLYYTYLGVKQAKIHARFPYEQCGRIVLVDTIGTGDVALGIEKDMLDTVKGSDAIILMMRPDPAAEIVFSEYYDLVEKLAKEVTPGYSSKMLFWLMNRMETEQYDNSAKVPKIIGQLEKQNLPVARYLNVDCSDQDDVENNLLGPILEQMSSQLASIDRMIVARANEQLIQLELAYRSISAQIKADMGADEDEKQEFYTQIRNTIDDTSDKLRQLYLDRNKEIDRPCEELKAAAAEKLKNVVSQVPTKEKIIKHLKIGTLMKFNVLQELADELRLQIINDFLELNKTLHHIVLQMKQDVVNILADPESGRLGFIVDADPSDPNAWLRALQDTLTPQKFPLLCTALEPLEAFDLRMENFLIYKVRCCLKPIDWRLSTKVPELLNDESDREALAEEIDDQLRSDLENVYNGIADELIDFYLFPNTALFAVLRDFHDRAFWAHGSGRKTAKVEWRYLYERSIPKIWAEDHKKYIAARDIAKEWSILTNDVQACAADGYFRIDLEGGNR